ncbi:MAG: ribbon-helix-helix domain-containing protein [Alphaproteobacteria bacterium]|nr:ribbon-helix-helix domain-containing protein [Alphaproteobacteria bacterium]
MSQAHIIKRSVVIAGHATSVSLEPEFWEALREIAVRDQLSIAALIRQIDQSLGPSDHRNLSSAIRVYILGRLKQESPTL